MWWLISRTDSRLRREYPIWHCCLHTGCHASTTAAAIHASSVSNVCVKENHDHRFCVDASFRMSDICSRIHRRNVRTGLPPRALFTSSFPPQPPDIRRLTPPAGRLSASGPQYRQQSPAREGLTMLTQSRPSRRHGPRTGHLPFVRRQRTEQSQLRFWLTRQRRFSRLFKSTSTLMAASLATARYSAAESVFCSVSPWRDKDDQTIPARI